MIMRRRLLCGMMALAVAIGVSAQDKSALRKLMAAKQNSRVANKTALSANVQKFPADKKGVWVKNLSTNAANNVRAPFKAPMKTEEVANTLWWGYTGTNGLMPYTFGLADYNLAIAVPSYYAGAKVDSVSVLLLDNTKLSNVNIWFQANTEGYPTAAKPEDADYYFPVDNSLLKGLTAEGVESTDLELPQTYTIPENGCFLGYTMTTQLDPSDGDAYCNYPVLLYQSDDESGGCLVYFEEGYVGDGYPAGFYDMYGTGIGNLTLALHLDVTGLESSNAALYSLGEATMMKGEETENYAYVDNNGFNPMSSVSYILTVDGVAQPEQTYTFDEPVEAGSYGEIAYSLTLNEADLHEISMEITKVDGKDNTSSYATANGTLIVLETAAERTSVVEEFTGTWCGWCPRGMVALKNLKEKFGDKVITLAGHFSGSSSAIDPMQCYDYAYEMANAGFVSGFPYAYYDRVLPGDPYSNGFYWEQEAQTGKYIYDADVVVQLVDAVIPSEGSVSLTAEWVDEAATKIAVTANTTFNYTRIDAPYGLAFILSEDGMTGNTEDWLQENYYAPEYRNYFLQNYGEDPTVPYNNDDMAEWFNASHAVEMAYDHVIVGSYNAVEGIDGSVRAPIFAGEADTYTTTLDVSSNTLIQNKAHLSLTALLINRNNYQIVNAAQVKLPVPTAIKGVNSTDAANNEVVARYNVSGQRVNAPVKGLNIVKLANGKSVKVIEK